MRRIQIVFLLLVLVLSAACKKGPDDATIASGVKNAMFSDPLLKKANTDVQVQVKDGEVTLSGTVRRAATQQRVVQVAQTVPGVTSVIDNTNLPGQAPQGRAYPGSGSSSSAPPPPPTIQIPAGTVVHIRTIDGIDSSVNRSGETFKASVETPVLVEGEDVIPKGADAVLLLAESRQAGRIKGRSDLEVRLDKLFVGGDGYQVSTNMIEEQGKSRGKDTALKTGIGAGIGAAIGALAGGGKGAAIGAGVGAGGGIGYQLMTHGQTVRVPSESVLTFHLTEPIAVTLK